LFWLKVLKILLGRIIVGSLSRYRPRFLRVGVFKKLSYVTVGRRLINEHIERTHNSCNVTRQDNKFWFGCDLATIIIHLAGNFHQMGLHLNGNNSPAATLHKPRFLWPLSKFATPYDVNSLHENAPLGMPSPQIKS
jgi:hypothetical protein